MQVDFSILLSFFPYAFLTAYTPGPANLVSLHTVGTYGWKGARSLLGHCLWLFAANADLCRCLYGISANPAKSCPLSALCRRLLSALSGRAYFVPKGKRSPNNCCIRFCYRLPVANHKCKGSVVRPHRLYGICSAALGCMAAALRRRPLQYCHWHVRHILLGRCRRSAAKTTSCP